MVKNLPASAGDVRDLGLIPGSGRSPQGEHATHTSILARRIPWPEEPGRLQSTGSQSWTRLKRLGTTRKEYLISCDKHRGGSHPSSEGQRPHQLSC